MAEYDIVSSETLCTTNLFSIRHDKVEMPDGKIAGRDLVVKGGAAAIVPVDTDGKIIFVSQYRHGLFKKTVEIPAGTLDDENEDPRDCAIRELEEEVAKKAGNMEFLFTLHPSVGFCSEYINIYLATDLTDGVQNLDDDEFVEILKFSPKDALKMIENGEITDSKTIAGVLYYCQKYD
ncbi:ADP-ribose pyrophosphatase [Clostridia bacterium]|nr:ADP-ribose pyrophosphatase [Clostridia bacterium]